MQKLMYINDLPLPEALARAVESGIWRTPKNKDVWHSPFPENEIIRPSLYPLAEMAGHSSWLGLDNQVYLGKNDEGISPGDIDQSLAVLIADLGPDRLIALDYRGSKTKPSVIALTSEKHSCWHRVTDDIESFMTAIRLTK